MRQPALLLAFAGSAAAAFARASTSEQSWTPPHETDVAEMHRAQLAAGWSPRPTDAPAALIGRMLVPRIDDFTLGPKTCGFQANNGDSITCITDGATCTYSDSHVGCCRPNQDCNIVKTTCMGYAASSAGSCNLPGDFHTLCCSRASAASCYTWLFTTTGSAGGALETFSALDCAATAGTGLLLDYDPAWARTHVFSSKSSTASESATATSGSDNSEGGGDDKKKSSTNIGAIVGGAVGGFVVLVLIGAAIFFCLRRKKKNAGPKSSGGQAAAVPSSMPQSAVHSPMSQNAPEPYWSGVPSGVPSSHQSYAQPGKPLYDPHVSMYSQSGYTQPHQGQYLPPGFQQQQQQQGQYPQPTSPVSYHTGSPPPLTTPSPGGGAGVGYGPPGQHGVNELQAVNPVGHENNRAELGPSQ
jgi:hypothetical protein